jgi:2-(1,2-epoxy-1,2-dihydrophenyl)acetyl-CoA isomerase
MTDYQNMTTELMNGVLTIKLIRPPANAFSRQMVEELIKVLKIAEADEAVRCLVFIGNEGHFSSGHDVAEISDVSGTDSYRYHLQSTYNRLVLRMRRLEKPIVGAINGSAVGAGLGFALATDIRWAAESARFIFGFTAIGLTTDAGTSLTLPLLMGMARATEMAFLNQPLTAEQALSYGLVSRVWPDEELSNAVTEMAARLAAGPTRSFGLTKRAFNRALLLGLEDTLDYEAYLQEIAHRTADHQEGIAAFLGKRLPEFRGN